MSIDISANNYRINIIEETIESSEVWKSNLSNQYKCRQDTLPVYSNYNISTKQHLLQFVML